MESISEQREISKHNNESIKSIEIDNNISLIVTKEYKTIINKYKIDDDDIENFKELKQKFPVVSLIGDFTFNKREHNNNLPINQCIKNNLREIYKTLNIENNVTKDQRINYCNFNNEIHNNESIDSNLMIHQQQSLISMRNLENGIVETTVDLLYPSKPLILNNLNFINYSRSNDIYNQFNENAYKGTKQLALEDYSNDFNMVYPKSKRVNNEIVAMNKHIKNQMLVLDSYENHKNFNKSVEIREYECGDNDDKYYEVSYFNNIISESNKNYLKILNNIIPHNEKKNNLKKEIYIRFINEIQNAQKNSPKYEINTQIGILANKAGSGKTRIIFELLKNKIENKTMKQKLYSNNKWSLNISIEHLKSQLSDLSLIVVGDNVFDHFCNEASIVGMLNRLFLIKEFKDIFPLVTDEIIEYPTPFVIKPNCVYERRIDYSDELNIVDPNENIAEINGIKVHEFTIHESYKQNIRYLLIRRYRKSIEEITHVLGNRDIILTSISMIPYVLRIFDFIGYWNRLIIDEADSIKVDSFSEEYKYSVYKPNIHIPKALFTWLVTASSKLTKVKTGRNHRVIVKKYVDSNVNETNNFDHNNESTMKQEIIFYDKDKNIISQIENHNEMSCCNDYQIKNTNVIKQFFNPFKKLIKEAINIEYSSFITVKANDNFIDLSLNLQIPKMLHIPIIPSKENKPLFKLQNQVDNEILSMISSGDYQSAIESLNGIYSNSSVSAIKSIIDALDDKNNKILFNLLQDKRSIETKFYFDGGYMKQRDLNAVNTKINDVKARIEQIKSVLINKITDNVCPYCRGVIYSDDFENEFENEISNQRESNNKEYVLEPKYAITMCCFTTYCSECISTAFKHRAEVEYKCQSSELINPKLRCHCGKTITRDDIKFFDYRIVKKENANLLICIDYESKSNIPLTNCCSKFQAIRGLVNRIKMNANNKKIVIFIENHRLRNDIIKIFDALTLEINNSNNNEKVLEKFRNDNNSQIMVLDPKHFSQAIDLSCADYLIVAQRDPYNRNGIELSLDELQIIGRCQRPNRKTINGIKSQLTFIQIIDPMFEYSVRNSELINNSMDF